MARLPITISRISPASAPQTQHKSDAEGHLPEQTGKDIRVPGLKKSAGAKRINTGGFFKKG